ncbi:MAG: hypothetical protein QOJ00_1955 [Actinomycetota bacterium]
MRVWAVALAAATAVLAVFVISAHGPTGVDRSALRFALDHRAHLVGVSRLMSHLGDPVISVALALVAALVLWRAKSRLVLAAVPIVALLGAAATGVVAKHLVARARPPAVYHLVHETDYSFPSGHVTAAAALYVACALVAGASLPHRARPIALGVAIATALAVGAARLLLGVHWLTDVLTGFTLGTTWAITAFSVGSARVWTTPHRARPSP